MIDLAMTSRRQMPAVGLALLLSAASVLARPEAVTWTPVHPGVDHGRLTREAPGGGSWAINLLRIDLARARLDVIRANDRAVGLERVSSIADRTSAIAAINGGYFVTSGEFRGDSTGTLKIDGAIWSEPDRARSSVGLVRRRSRTELLFGPVVWKASVAAGGRRRVVDGTNRARGPDELVLFTPTFGPVTLTDASGIEAVVRSGRVVDRRDLSGATPIPRDGLVLSARGEAAAWVRETLAVGTRVRVQTTLEPAGAFTENPWARAEDAVGAGPRLVSDGRVDITTEREKMLPAFRSDTHPRTAMALLADGRALLLVADGRHPPARVGLALDDLAQLLVELGARQAINLDGGGSSTMVVRGLVVNTPSDATGERPVSDAIVVTESRRR